MFEQKVNRCQNYKLGLSLVDSVTEKNCEISDFPTLSLTKENVGSWLWRYYSANLLILFVPLPLILYRVVIHIFINSLSGWQGAHSEVFLYILYGKEIILSQNFFIPKFHFQAYHLTEISTDHKFSTESSPPECWGLDKE